MVQFNRVARLLRNILVRVLRLPAIHYYDDFPVVAPFALWSVMDDMVKEVAEVTGFRWKAEAARRCV